MVWTYRYHNRPRIYNLLHRLGLADAITQTAPEERACLCRHISSARIAVEIGTYMGVTAAQMARALPEGGRLYCVDPYFNCDATKALAQRHLRRSGAAGRIQMLFCTGPEAVGGLPSEVDFFFVDGDHSYDGLLRDWKVVKQLLKPGGIAGFHDAAKFSGAVDVSEGAIKFFDEVIRQDEGFEPVETCLSLQVIRRKA